MSEASDKVRGLHELPLFPLPVVLFPGVPLPLHIFEQRYRQMLLDIRLAKNVFGRSSKRIAQMSLGGFLLLAVTYFGMGFFRPFGGA